MSKPVKKVAMLTAGGLAPCLSSAVGGLIERYSEIEPDVELIAYVGGYKGLLSASPSSLAQKCGFKQGCCTNTAVPLATAA